MSTKDDPDTQQGNDSFDLDRLKHVGMGSFWESRNATSFIESYVSEVDISI